MIVADRQVDAEAVPGFGMPVPKMLGEAGAQVRREPDVVELVVAIEGIDPVAPPDELSEELLVVL